LNMGKVFRSISMKRRNISSFQRVKEMLRLNGGTKCCCPRAKVLTGMFTDIPNQYWPFLTFHQTIFSSTDRRDSPTIAKVLLSRTLCTSVPVRHPSKCTRERDSTRLETQI
jgi:hypothetical protein